MDIKTLADNGFIIYVNQEGKTIVEKKPSKINKIEIKSNIFEDIDDGINYINNILNKPKEWAAIIRYNRGLGIEYKTIKPILAELKEDAKKIAAEQAEKKLGNSIIEIKVAPIENT